MASGNCKDCKRAPKAPGRSRCWPCYTAHRRQDELVAASPWRELGPVAPGLGFIRSVAWDCETTNLSAGFGHLLCCSFTDFETGETWTLRLDEEPYTNPDDPIDDSRLAVAIRDTLEAYDVLVSWNGILYDHKFLKARLLKAGERLPEKRWVVDPLWNVRSNFRMSGKLGNVSEYLGLEPKPAPSLDEWARAGAGHKESMDIIVNRCEADTRILADAARRLKPTIQKLERKG